nr:hypothetical protein [Pandoravirus belohorizontensis]
MVLTVIIIAIVFESRRRGPNTTPSTPVTPTGPSSPSRVAAPVGAPLLAAGHYKIRWAPTGLYLGVDAIGGNLAALVSASTAPTWTYATAPGVAGGSLTSSTGSALSTGTVTALVGPVPVSVSRVGAVAATSSWVAARDPSGSATLPGTIYNAALGGCLRPNRDGGIGSPIVLAPSCSATEHGWVFEPATA